VLHVRTLIIHASMQHKNDVMKKGLPWRWLHRSQTSRSGVDAWFIPTALQAVFIASFIAEYLHCQLHLQQAQTKILNSSFTNHKGQYKSPMSLVCR